MKKKFTLILASMFLCMGTAWAQLNFTFSRDRENATVNVAGGDGVTATITATSPSPQNNVTKKGVWNTGGTMATATDVLCTSTNTKDATEDAPITYTLTVNGLSANQVFSGVTFVSKAVAGGGGYQSANTGNKHYCNFSLTANGNHVATIEQVAIMVNSNAGVTKEVVFTNSVPVVGSSLTLTLAVWNHSDNPGCFYGLTGITLQTYNSQLSALVAEAEALYNSYAPYTGKLGGYTQDAMNTLNAAITTAKAVETATAENVADLQAAIDVFSETDIIKPVAGKYYVLRCNYDSRYLYANTDNKMYYWGGGNYTAGDSRAVWQFEAGDADGTFKMKSVHNQAYVPTVSSSAAITFNATGADVTIAASSSAPGAVTFTAGNEGIGIHANQNPAIGYTNGAAANHYFVEEVADFSHTLKVGAAEWSTLVLGFNAAIPTAEGFNAYTIASVQDGYVTLEEATGVLAANVPVLVNATQGNYTFAYTAEEATVTTSGLEGTLYDQNISADAYVLAKKNDVIGLYKAELNKNEAGEDVSENGTHFKNNANKAYLVLPAETEAPVMFSLGRGEGTTAIDNVELATGNVVIYDLAGRRVEKMEKGIYIVNGKKVVR